MKNKRGFINILIVFFIGIALLYYFKADVAGIFDYIGNTYRTYFTDAQHSIKQVDWNKTLPTSTSR